MDGSSWLGCGFDDMGFAVGHQFFNDGTADEASASHVASTKYAASGFGGSRISRGVEIAYFEIFLPRTFIFGFTCGNGFLGVSYSS